MSEPFDFEAFINGTSLARRTVGAYRVDHRDEIDRLTREHDALPRDDGDQRETSGLSRRQEVAERIAALRAEMEASRVEWVLRTLTPDEFRDLPDDDADATKAKIAAGGVPPVFEQIALQSRAPDGCPNPSLYSDLPNLTAEQWRKIAGVIGAGQWSEIVGQANALILSKVAVPDFSPSVSATRKPPASSAS